MTTKHIKQKDTKTTDTCYKREPARECAGFWLTLNTKESTREELLREEELKAANQGLKALSH